MRSHWTVPVLGLYLIFSLGCNSKPAATTAPADSTSSSTATSQPPTSSSTPAANSTAMTAAADQTASTAMKAADKVPAAQPLVIPVGTQLTVRLGQSVGSKISQPGQSFSATLAAPVEVGGKVAIPSGANATGTVVDAKALGRFAGGARLQLQLNSVSINGSDRAIQTSSVVRTIAGKGKRTGILAGGGAGLGAIIGGIAGGGKGAAIGALAGGGAGTGGAAFTGNKEIVLPAESAVTFKLEQSVEVR